MPLEFLTIKEVAAMLKTSESSVYTLFNRPDFPAKKLPNVGWRVLRSDMDNYFSTIRKYSNE